MANIVHGTTATGGESGALQGQAAWNADHVSPVTTKGDLLVRDATVLQRVPIGADAQVLTADSTQALGVKWATPAAGASGIVSVVPTTISGLQLWVKADQIGGADLSSVATWADQSGLAQNLVAAGVAQPVLRTNILNGLPIVRFNGTANGMRAISVTLTEFLILVVAKVTTMQMLYEHSDNTNVADGSFLYDNADTLRVRRAGVASAAINLVGGWNNARTGFSIYEHRFTQGAQVLLRDGMVILSATTTPISIVSTAQPFNLGARNNAASLFTAADIAEVIVYTTIPNFEKVLGLYKYLTAKYAL